MRRMMGTIVGLAVMATLFAIPESAIAACTTRGTQTLQSPSLTPGDVDNKQTDAYKLVVPKGQQGYVHVAFANGDIDISVCKVSTAKKTKIMCDSHNFAVFGDGCHLPEANVPLPEDVWGPDAYLVEWGPALPAGTYRINVKHCFSSKDGPACDYAATDPLLGEPLSPGALDDAPAIQYVLAAATN